MLGLLLTLAVLAAGGVYAASEWKLRRTYDAPLMPLSSAETPDLAEGERMARIVGCWDGCHGAVGGGGHWALNSLADSVAPTLSQVLPRYRDDELVRLIRYGIKRDGRSAVGMSSYTFWSLSERDLANIIAHLRRQPQLPPLKTERHIHWRGRLALATGGWRVSAEQVDRTRPRWGDQPQTTPVERGRYLASITCTECHGIDFRGNPQEGAPSLAIIAAYSPATFLRLIRTAEPIGGRVLADDMQWVSSAPFTDDEVMGLYAFLTSAEGPVPQVFP
jgi:cytochrome c553